MFSSILCFVVVIFVVFPIHIHAGEYSQEMLEIAFVHSYESDYPGSSDEELGVIKGLIQEGYFEGVSLKIHRFYMNTKTENTSPEKKQSIATEIRSQISNLNQISLVTTFDDNAILYVGMEENKEKPVVFLGMNQQPEYYNQIYNFMNNRFLPGKNTTGVYEKIFVAESLRLFSQIVPDLINGKVIGIFDNTTTGILVKAQVIAEMNETSVDLESMNITFPLITVSSMEDYQNVIINQVNADSDVIAIYYAVLSLQKDKNDPSQGNHDVVEIIRWTILNNHKPEISIGPPFAIYGLFGGSGNDYTNMGEKAGEMIGRILNEEVSVGDIPLEFDPRYGIYFNIDRIKQLRPYVNMIEEDKMNDLLKVADYVFSGQTALLPENPPVPVPNDGENPLSLWWLSLVFSSLMILMILLFCFISCIFCCIFLFIFCCCCCLISISCLYLLRLKVKQRKFDRIRDLDEILILQELKDKRNQNNFGIPEMSIDAELFRIPYEHITLKKVIGSGGSDSTVFAAKWKSQDCAFKSFRIHGKVDDTYFEEFEKELMFLMSLKHPNLLDFYGVVYEEGRLGLVMELCELGDLSTFISNKKLLEQQISVHLKLSIFGGIIEGMEYLHDRNVIHRDMKSQNILLDDDNEAKIIDFGVSKQKNNSNHQTRNVGTSLFMAPEVSKGLYYDEKIDVFSFAMVMFVIMTEKVDFFDIGMNQDSYGIEMRIANDPNFRPIIPKVWIEEKKFKEDGVHLKWYFDCMKSAWSNDPSKRPSFKKIKKLYDKNYRKKKELN